MTADGDPWRALRDALDEGGGGAPLRFWLRDDDAVTPSPALECLGTICEAADAPLLLAVIPRHADAALGRWTAAHAWVTPCQHGFAHRNHAGPGERACELGGTRDDEAVLDELARGRAAMDRAFEAGSWTPILVPPWNRIRPSLLPHLPGAGYTALSTFAGSAVAGAQNLPLLDSDLDIIDWRNSRSGRSADDLCRRAVELVQNARRSGLPIGVLTHHRAHDDTAWAGLKALTNLVARHRGAVWVSAKAALKARAAVLTVS